MRTTLSLVSAATLSALPISSVASDKISAAPVMVSPASPGLLVRLGLPGSFAWQTDFARQEPDNAIIDRGRVFAPPLSPLRLYPELAYADPTGSGQSFNAGPDRVFAVAYSWRSLTFEGATAGSKPSAKWTSPEIPGWKFLSRIARLSYQPLPGLAMRFSRGTWSPVDRLVSDGDVKRSSLSASYTHRITGGEWQTTLAWGRNSREGRESLMGYLAETSIRFAGSHLAFGRIEQVGSDDVVGLSSSAGGWTRLNKVSLGYYHDLHRSRPGRLGLGLVASRHLLPSSYPPVARKDPVSYMLFMRVNLQ